VEGVGHAWLRHLHPHGACHQDHQPHLCGKPLTAAGQEQHQQGTQFELLLALMLL
jgi:hypothetical protein